MNNSNKVDLWEHRNLENELWNLREEVRHLHIELDKLSEYVKKLEYKKSKRNGFIDD